MGVYDSDTCKALKANVCSVSKDYDNANCSNDVPEERRIVLRCGGKLQCWDIYKLDSHIKKTPTFKAKFSSYQLKRVKKMIQRLKDSEYVPCNTWTGNRYMCDRTEDRCIYETHGLFFATTLHANDSYYLSKDY